MLPRVIVHNAMSLDGRLDVSLADIGLYYELAQRWQADAALSGSNTMLAAYPPEQRNDEGVDEGPGEKPQDARPLLVVVDSRGRIQNWRRISREPYWGQAVVLCSRSTPREYLDYVDKAGVECIIAGDDRVDLRAALEQLNVRFGVKVVRVDSGGVLNGVLLRAGLVDELSVMIDPSLVGGTSPRSIFIAPDLTSPEGAVSLKLMHMERVRGDTVWLRYEVAKRWGGGCGRSRNSAITKCGLAHCVQVRICLSRAVGRKR